MNESGDDWRGDFGSGFVMGMTGSDCSTSLLLAASKSEPFFFQIIVFKKETNAQLSENG